MIWRERCKAEQRTDSSTLPRKRSLNESQIFLNVCFNSINLLWFLPNRMAIYFPFLPSDTLIFHLFLGHFSDFFGYLIIHLLLSVSESFGSTSKSPKAQPTWFWPFSLLWSNLKCVSGDGKNIVLGDVLWVVKYKGPKFIQIWNFTYGLKSWKTQKHCANVHY